MPFSLYIVLEGIQSHYVLCHPWSRHMIFVMLINNFYSNKNPYLIQGAISRHSDFQTEKRPTGSGNLQNTGWRPRETRSGGWWQLRAGKIWRLGLRDNKKEWRKWDPYKRHFKIGSTRPAYQLKSCPQIGTPRIPPNSMLGWSLFFFLIIWQISHRLQMKLWPVKTNLNENILPVFL